VSDPAQSEETLDALCARIVSNTQALRDAVPDATTRTTERMLLSDLARVVAMLRSDVTALGESLARAVEPGATRPEKERHEP